MTELAVGRPPQLTHPLSPQAVPDPYPSYDAYRRVAPAFHDPATGMWLLTDHPGCRRALTDPAFSASEGQRQRVRDDELPVSMLTTDGAQHRRLRAAAASALSAQSVRNMMPAVRAAAADLVHALPPAAGPVDAAGRHGTALVDGVPVAPPGPVVDIVTALAEPFAAATIGIALHLERDHWPQLQLLSAWASVNLDPTITGGVAESARRASTALAEFLAAHSERMRLASPPSDLAGLPLDADLSRAERVGVFTLIAVGGYQPLVLLLAAAVDQLLCRPRLQERLRVAGDPDLAIAVVDETLRMHTPIPFTARVCAGAPRAGVPQGGRALAIVAAANRDPAVFDRPAEFDPDRPVNPHLAFGAGPHFCLGAALVRQASALMLTQLVRGRPGMGRVHGRPPVLRPSVIPRGLASLPVTWPAPRW